MITRIEIDGFKTFRNFSLELAPLQEIVGPNGAGKSNLFDALHLLAQLAGDADLRTAFQQLRGEAGELFTIQPDGQRTDRLHLTVELLVEPTVQDSWGAQATLKYTRLRYGIAIVRRTDEQGLDRLYVEHEALAPIPRSEDRWSKRYGLLGNEHWLPPLTGGRSAAFISTSNERDRATVYLHQDGRSGRNSSVAERMARTVLSGVLNTEFPHAFAAREAMRAWRFLQLNTEVLRQPNSMVGPQRMAADGRYLPGALARLQATDPLLLADVSRDLANLVPGVVKVELEMDKARDQYVIWARMGDGRRFSSRVLSDGTLRMLALVTLKNDPDHQGVLCFEEPENGVHPFRLKNIAQVLSELATDFSDPEQQAAPLRQLLSNTHSPRFIGQPAILPHVLFAYTALQVDPATPHQPERVTRIVPIHAPGKQLLLHLSPEEISYTLAEVEHYLENADLGEVRTLLAANGSLTATTVDRVAR